MNNPYLENIKQIRLINPNKISQSNVQEVSSKHEILRNIWVSKSLNGNSPFVDTKVNLYQLISDIKNPDNYSQEIILDIRKKVAQLESESFGHYTYSREYIKRLHYILPAYRLALYDKEFISRRNFNYTQLLKYEVEPLDPKGKMVGLEAFKESLKENPHLLLMYKSTNGKSWVIYYYFSECITSLDLFDWIHNKYSHALSSLFNAWNQKYIDFDSPGSSSYYYHFDMFTIQSFDPDIYVNENAIPLPVYQEWYNEEVAIEEASQE